MSGARCQVVPSAVVPSETGNAESPTIAMRTVTTTTAPIAEKRLRGRSRPGSRVSPARFATVSRPVYARNASGTANVSWCQDGLVPRWRPCRSACGEKRKAKPSDDEQQLRHEVEHRHEKAGRVDLRAGDEPRGGDPRDDDAAEDDVARVLRDRLDAERQPEVVRQEERRERDHDQVVEEERPAGEETGEVVERDAHECRRAAGAAVRGRPLDVRRRDDEEDQPDEREHDRRHPERVERDDPEREVDRGGDLAVRDGRERRRVERPLEPRQLSRHEERLTPPGEVQAADPEREEEHAEQIADRAASLRRGLDEQREPEPERDRARR